MVLARPNQVLTAGFGGSAVVFWVGRAAGGFAHTLLKVDVLAAGSVVDTVDVTAGIRR